MSDFTLPELGENIAAGDVLRVLVKPGDTLTKDQPVLELETDKATIEVPSSVAGQVKEVKVKVGDKVKVGQAILSVDGGAAKGDAPAAEAAKTAAPAKAPSAPAPAAPAPAAPASAVAAAKPTPPEEEDTRPVVQPSQKVVDINRGARQTAEASEPDFPVAPASPSVRRMARELGVDIGQVAGSGPGGRISIDDVKALTKKLVTTVAAGGSIAGVAEALPDFTRWGAIDRQPMRAVRRKTAEHLSAAWTTIPHVTQHDLADATGLEELRKRYAKQTEAAG